MTDNTIPTLDDILSGEVASGNFDPVPEGDYNVVLTTVELRTAKKSGLPYLAVMATIFDGEYERRNVWGNSSFSPNALPYPGAARNLSQAVGVTADSFPEGTQAEDIPALLAELAQGSIVTITTKQEHAQDASGKLKYLSTGEPQMKDSIKAYAPPSAEFEAAFEKAVSEVDTDLPF